MSQKFLNVSLVATCLYFKRCLHSFWKAGTNRKLGKLEGLVSHRPSDSEHKIKVTYWLFHCNERIYFKSTLIRFNFEDSGFFTYHNVQYCDIITTLYSKNLCISSTTSLIIVSMHKLQRSHTGFFTKIIFQTIWREFKTTE